MTNPYPADFADDTGQVRLGGEITFTDQANQPGGGSVTARELLSGNNTAIANGATGSLTWDSTSGPDTLLNRSDLGNPAVIEAGVYAVSIGVQPSAGMTNGGFYEVQLTLDAGASQGFLREQVQDSPIIAAAQQAPYVAMSMTLYIPAGGTINVTVANGDGVSSRSFYLVAVQLQRISGPAA